MVDIVKQAEVNLFSYGEIPVIQGKRKIILKSLGDRVLVQIPCTNNEIKCERSSFYKSCTGDTCGLKCENSVWVIKITCSSPTLQCTRNNNPPPDFTCGSN